MGDEIRSIRAIRAAQNAGVGMAAVSRGFNLKESLLTEIPDHMLQKPSELLALVG